MNFSEKDRDSETPDVATATTNDGSNPLREASAGTSQSELERDLADARAKAASYLDLAQRTQADFLNFKRRVEQERGDFARSARADILLKVLPAIDDLDLAVGSQPRDVAGTDWAHGVVLIDRKLRGSLEALGLKSIEVVGKPFDPWQEESVGYEPSDSIPAESVTRVVRSGYVLDGKVIRPAQVLLSNGPLELRR